jgi:hypothetical protein
MSLPNPGGITKRNLFTFILALPYNKLDSTQILLPLDDAGNSQAKSSR